MTAQKITSLKVRDYKGVRGEVTVFPEGKHLVVIAGPNGAGKSSYIDGVAEVFDPKGTRLTSKPIHEGAATAEVEVTTTEARLVRKWTKEDAGQLTAYALDGAKYPSGKDFVVQATGGAIFDARAFVSLDEKKQRDELLARVELPFDLAKLDADRKAAFDGRTDVTREVKRLTAVRAALTKPAGDVPAEEESAAAIIAEITTARELNAARESNEARRAEGAAYIADLRAKIAAAEATIAQLLVDFEKMPPAVDTVALTARLESVEQTNAAVRAARVWAEVDAALSVETTLEAELTATLAFYDKQKRDGLAAAKFPVAGLSVDDNGITFDGVPFKQVNTAQQTLVAFKLLTTSRPDLRLIFIKDGDSLDAVTLDAIRADAETTGYLVLMERDRDESREIASAVFTDGQVLS